MIKVVSLLACTASLLVAQAPLGFTSKTLMHEPLGTVTDPKMSLYVLTLAAGANAPSHSHTGALFAYVLEGDIENQFEPDPPKVYHPGDTFHEKPMQVHRVFRNLSETKPARILVLQNTGTVSDRVKLLSQATLEHTSDLEVNLTTIVADPSYVLTRAHQHPGPVFGYLLKGEVESQVDPDPPKMFRAGDGLFEPPMHAHRLYRNLSATESAELLLFGVGEKGKPMVMEVTK